MRDVTRVYGLFCIFYAASQDRFLMSHVSNHLTVEAVIMLETNGFSRAIRDKIIIRENNRIAKCTKLIFTLFRALSFSSRVSRLLHDFLISWMSPKSSVVRFRIFW